MSGKILISFFVIVDYWLVILVDVIVCRRNSIL